MKQYSIRKDYQPRGEAVTRVTDANDYWTEARIAAAGYYQYPVYQTAARYLRKMKSRVFADVGCGYPIKTQELIAPLAQEVVLIDQPSVAELVRRDFPNMKFTPLDLERANAGFSNSFDCVVCADVVEHLLDPDPLVDFVRRALKSEGVAIISTPERDVQRGANCTFCPKPEHVREWNSAEFICYIEDSGFEIIDHRLVPKGRALWFERCILPFLGRWAGPRFRGCQLAVCRRSR